MTQTKTQQLFDKLKKLITHSHNRFKGVKVNDSLNIFADNLLNDWNTRNDEKQYLTYHRGTVVYVDFGLNVGAELSGPHYGIILNKHDNPVSAKVTVVPLTSKEGAFNIPLPTGLTKVLGEWYAVTGLVHSKNFQPVTPDTIFDLFAVSEEKRNNHGHSKTEQRMLERFNQYREETNLIKSELKKQLLDLEKISYFKIDNVATISKYRIQKPHHKFDALGRMTLPSDDMDLIDQQIVQHLLDK
ncbi:type II toxin-antitoxin system PemK/MazF family toxin [Secundilactobacillus similis]|uniref:Uncharacterized protein n=1 Tax=Secundilactobacillus similis DSM 23365 = JCM 2765 TaxID=1423804 RepID=A0A0R2EZL4_9LACO|nr:type II toxin-antitoxin system PemK/MazF family toxin [Secundilactobacillus similis]KRN20619.1 hypothetical protein FD14_GL001404 [Secundilactobacillus similis DSM 23365 = JCM 2765]